MDFPGLPSLRCFGGGENCDFRRDEVSIAELFSLLPRILCKQAAQQVISRGCADGGPGLGPARWQLRRACSVCREPTASRIGEVEGAGRVCNRVGAGPRTFGCPSKYYRMSRLDDVPYFDVLNLPSTRRVMEKSTNQYPLQPFRLGYAITQTPSHLNIIRYFCEFSRVHPNAQVHIPDLSPSILLFLCPDFILKGTQNRLNSDSIRQPMIRNME